MKNIRVWTGYEIQFLESQVLIIQSILYQLQILHSDKVSKLVLNVCNNVNFRLKTDITLTRIFNVRLFKSVFIREIRDWESLASSALMGLFLISSTLFVISGSMLTAVEQSNFII